MALKTGRRAPKNAPAILFSRIRTAAVPAHPASEDYGLDFKGWQMLGNDQYGDCVAVTWANQRALVTTALTGTTDYPSQDEVFAFYETQNPGFPQQDDGMEIQTALEALVKSGGPDGVKAVAFAKVDYTNLEELQAAHAVFGQVWYGINVYDQNQTQFSDGQEWTYSSSDTLDGGHSVTGVGYDPADTRFITWAAETDWNDSFRQHAVEEAWVVIWPEHLGSKAFLAGVDESALAADYQALTGSTFPVQPNPEPPNPPGPAPVPPAPGPAPVVDYQTVVDAFIAEIPPNWENKTHEGGNKTVALAVRKLRQAVGLSF